MSDNRSPVWGGATAGLLVGLVLGFFVGTYWMTVLYAVLIGAALGVAANVLARLGSSGQRRPHRRDELSSASEELSIDEISMGLVEETLQEHSPSDFETSPKAAIMCVNAARDLEERDWWRFGYDSLDSFYATHENKHPDIRLYAAAGRAFPIPDSLELPDGSGSAIARRIAEQRQTPPPRGI